MKITDKIEEIYLSLNFISRILVCFLIGGLACYLYLDPIVEQNKNELKAKKEDLVREVTLYKKRIYHKDNIKKKDLEYQNKRIKIKNMRKNIPTYFKIDSILKYIAKSTSANGALLQSFKPEAVVPIEASREYVVLPIQFVISGRYKMVMKSLDKITRFQYANKIKDFSFIPILNREGENKNIESSKDNIQLAKRNNLFVKAMVLIHFYRSYTDEEFEAVK